MPYRKRELNSEIVVGKIKQLILDKGLRSGDRLPTEHEMARNFGVSRISVREATKALSFLGIIRGAPRRGISVGELDLERVTQYLGFHLALNHHPNVQIIEARIVIETGALPYTMDNLRAHPEIAGRLLEMARRIKGTTDPEKRIDEDAAFHRALLDASGIEPLAVFSDLLQVFFNRFRRSLLAGARKLGDRDHRSIVEALADGRIELAREILRRHIEYHKPFLGSEPGSVSVRE
jgi:GntR family transcriptional regulator, transcriptional repressor for pyruvate dehydrogenase complex